MNIVSLADWRRRVAELYTDIRRAADPETAWQLWRETRDELFRGHEQSPIPAERRAQYGGIPLFDYDPELRFEVDLAAPATGEVLAGEIGADGQIALRPLARTRGLAGKLGGELTLYWIEGYGGGLFLPFTDATSGNETYGGGRYVLDSIKSADLGQTDDGRLIVDFNFAYHPSCYHSEDWVYPLAPPENRLPEPVRAGERMAHSGNSNS
ncbi:DUF1684 domain-containing protein [Nisaea acidiphila]|uniref:DUF1684 domain-containing protein n=1 Tax=Nisaea acidiphila TaxID=1862145 RepID=A0A9J7AMW3_9PROT|nr:DUF1684 domain-containing protein [Nisaea acidiphila]UUX48792.1 DUF1684 domain-containing protein [Nisaea acidiphila]